MSSSSALFYLIPLLFGFTHGLLFALLLVIRGGREERRSDFVLAGLIGAGCLLLLPTILGLLEIHVLWDEWLFLPHDPGLLIGPLVLIFIQSHTKADFRFHPHQLVHLIPFSIYAGYHLIIFSQGQSFTFDWMDRVDLPYINPIYNLATLASMSLYLHTAIQEYRAYSKEIREEFVTPDTRQYGWIPGILAALAIAILSTCIFRLFEALSFDMDYLQAWSISAIVTVCIYYISIAGFTAQRAPSLPVRADVPSSPALNDGEKGQLMANLSRLMEEEKVFLNPDLNLSDLAQSLNATRNQISEAINSSTDKNFRRYVNEYRIRAFKQLVSEGKLAQYTLFGLAMESGFNSKATFNRVFKQLEGLSPTAYTNRTTTTNSARKTSLSGQVDPQELLG